MWDANAGTVQRELKHPLLGVSRVAFSPDNREVATIARDQIIRFWNTSTGELVDSFALASNLGPWHALSFNKDGSRFLAGPRLYDRSSGRELLYIGCTTQQFAPDSQSIVSGGGPVVIVRQIATPAEIDAWEAEERANPRRTGTELPRT